MNRTVAAALLLFGAFAMASAQKPPMARRAPAPTKLEAPRGEGAMAAAFVLFGGIAEAPGRAASHPSTATTDQFRRTLKDLRILPEGARMMVSLGGLVQPAPSDLLATRLDAWQTWLKSELRYPEMIAVPGPEVIGATPTWVKWGTKEKYFSVAQGRERADFVHDASGVRFIGLDTETPGPSGQSPWIDLNWLKARLAEAQSSSRVRTIVVVGFRPLTVPASVELSDAMMKIVGSEAWKEARKLLESTPKVVGYFCGSPAAYDVATFGQARKVHQIVLGNGGGPLDPKWKPAGGQHHGFGILAVYQNGAVEFVPALRKAAQPGTPTDKIEPTAARREIELKPRDKR
jgi:hypothetical protein